MSLEERKELYTQIESFRKRPLIAYVTSIRKNAAGQIGPDVTPYFIQQLQEVSKSSKEIDILIVSNGGDGIVPWRLITMMRERFEKVGVLLPYVAYSAATLFAMGADEIIMHPYSNLGPVDPQLTIPSQDGQRQMQFPADDIRHFLEFVKHDVGITDQEQLQRAFDLLAEEVGAISIGFAKRSIYLTTALGQQLLKLHMADDSQAKTISEALNRSFYHHSFTLGVTQAKKIGLPIYDPDDKLAELLWNVWLNFEKDMECNNPFDPLLVALQDTRVENMVFAEPPYFQVPVGLPQQLVDQYINQWMQQITNLKLPFVDFQLFIAALESVRYNAHYKVNGKLTAFRLPDMNLSVNLVKKSEGWQSVT